MKIKIYIYIITILLFSKINAQWTNYTPSNSGLISNNVQALAIDNQGNIWVGCNQYSGIGGIFKFNGTNWTNYTSSNSGLVDNNIQAIAIDAQGNKWFGTEYGGVSKFDGTNWTTYNTSTTDSAMAYDNVNAIAFDAQGYVWLGTIGGVSMFDGAHWFEYNTISGLVNNNVQSIAIDSQGNKWFGTWGGVSRFDGINWTSYFKVYNDSGLLNNNILVIAIDSAGNKWFGTNNGVTKFDGTNWTNYGAFMLGNEVLSIAIDSAGHKWFGTNIGVSKFDGINWTNYTTSNSGLLGDTISSIVLDRNGNEWFGTLEGLQKLHEIPIEAINVNPANDSIAVEENASLLATISPWNATFTGYFWTSSNDAVAIVNDSGIVTGIATGTAYIVATVEIFGNYTDTCKVIVIGPNNQINQTISQLSFYPNPARDYITIKGTNTDFLQIQIADLNGIVLIEEQIRNKLVDITSLLPGIYILRINNSIFKLVKL